TLYFVSWQEASGADGVWKKLMVFFNPGYGSRTVQELLAKRCEHTMICKALGSRLVFDTSWRTHFASAIHQAS
ncbi:MAG TPA: hypothetical protein VJM76_00370, partial [Gammaproteobacteria bacterium]|nr:hypothetical protein [Gammaproteobacteria bacterium]